MIPTSTGATLQLVKAVPSSAKAFVVFLAKEATPDVAGLPVGPTESLKRLTASGIFSAGANEVSVQAVGTDQRLIVVGIGDQKKVNASSYREAAAAVGKLAIKQKLADVAVVAPSTADAATIEAIVEGLLVGSFEYREYHGTVKKSAANAKTTDTAIKITLVNTSTDKAIGAAVDRARIIAESQNLSRTIASRPGNDINPPELAKVAQQLAKDVKITCRVLDEKEMKRLGMGGILAVGAGSSTTPPRMIVLDYRGAKASAKPLLLVGKSITFDSGGISIKPADRMGHMIYDKSGGTAVLGIMNAVAKLKLPINVVGILTSAENLLSSTAYRPGDILRMYNGVTVDVTNTDAEGRLVLGDALAWGIETYKPAAVVDMATLTGGVVIGLGKALAGVMTNSDELMEEFNQASTQAGEKIWRLPIWDEHRDLMKGQASDLVNAGPSRDASPLQGGAFLSYFVKWQGNDMIPWAHFDIAGVADTEKELPLYAKGSTGWGVRTMVRWIAARAAGK